MQTADRSIATAMMAFSIYCMWHALELPIGWVPESGPGGGAFPFWLSAIMLTASAGVLVRSIQGNAENSAPFFDADTFRSVVLVVLALFVTMALIPFAGVYIALPLFLFWYLRPFGGHGWLLTAAITLLTPVFLFFFFEVTLKILLPKGYTEPLFFPLYAAFF